ncbi:Glucose/arabinose dehydrogenase, beta-propeller fold [Clostridium cavendishii DSM 21758]|uniref:Glucose/arabinose dehydrogenase, beta-propeller fold n=1 Tax=Clostridium cavendishii DSM 21758 TaxID=1121302 RepID=A0A1M6NL08_9CLOT|nr:PQQ-dependent sugar dehydrogenase [Clostridium cavendishii]SHJ96411.1 Glucose/arabinose dehydrogenase, beta-propeller fold [Clostridium cavendishii DSM 21758]
MKKIIYNSLYNIIFRNSNIAKVKLKVISARQIPYNVQIVAENLYIPWAIDISDKGIVYFTERSGAIRVIEDGKLKMEPIIKFSPPFVSVGEGGLMGLVLDRNYSQNHYIYVMHSYIESNIIYNRVVRLFENNNRAVINKILLDKIPGGQIHNGGRIKIGPDNKLYITTGDAGNSLLAQDLKSTAGKILRIELDGSIPKDNPIINSPIYSLGHRNPQGLAWNFNNILYESEHGQSAHDEINIIKPGLNYGWPMIQGNEESTEIIAQKPLIQSGEETWAPSGIVFIKQGPWKEKLLVANLRGQQLLVMSLNRSGTVVRNVYEWLKNDYGRLREVIEGKDGSIYLSTSNRDGRGNPTVTDDKIIRLIPK